MAILDFITHPAVIAGATIALLLLLPHIWTYLNGFAELPTIPSVGVDPNAGFRDFQKAKERWMTDNLAITIEGYQKFKKGIFKLWTQDGFKVVLSPEFAHEIRNVPENVLSLKHAAREQLMIKYTKFQDSGVATKCVRIDLNKSYGPKVPLMAREAEYSLSTRLGECEDWTGYPLYEKILQVVAITTGALFIGVPQNRDVDWLQTAIMYTVDVFAGAQKIRQKRLPQFLVPLIASFTPEMQRYTEHMRRASEIVAPIVRARYAGEAAPQDDMIQWLMASATTEEEKQPDHIARSILQISLASIHTTALSLAKVVFELASRPEYVAPLREEIQRALDAEGGYTYNAIQQLDLCDSFLKESQRVSPIANLSMRRKVMAPNGFTFSNGAHMPCGHTIVGMTTAATGMDPEIYENPEQFDGYRFLKLRKVDEQASAKNVFSSTSLMGFGMGRHACPGRFFASTEIKMLLAEIVMKYDIRMKDGGGRPKDVCWEMARSVDAAAVVEFRKRR